MLDTPRLHEGSRKSAGIRFSRSIRGRLTLLFSAMFAAIVLLGMASAWSLSHSIEVSIVLRDRWLPNVRLLGDLNNFSSDARTAEANMLLAGNATERDLALREMQELSRKVADAQREYEVIPHSDFEAAMYHDFSNAWLHYRQRADLVAKMAREGRPLVAAALYRGPSQDAFAEASEMLGRLTLINVELAAQASERSAAAYSLARLVTAVTLLLAGIMLVIVIMQVRRRVSFPLVALGQVMHRLAENDISVEVGYTGRADEIGEMARAVMVFRANAVELMHSRSGLAQQATMLEEKLAHEQFVAQAQRNFVSMIAHEFRTPLTQIDAQAQRFHSLKDRLEPEAIVERAGRIRISVTRIVRMIDRLLDATRLVDGDPRMFFHPDRLDLLEVLRETCRLYREISPGAFILLDAGRESLDVIGDRKLLGQAVGNLVANAIKYSPDTPRVVVRGKRVAGEIVVAVEDSGIGIPAEDLGNIFQRYHRGSNVGGFVGSGIGLFLVATVARLHGGEVAVESEVGKGSRFMLTLKAAGHEADIAAQPPVIAGTAS